MSQDFAPDPNRHCGDCTACCALMAIIEVDKPHFAECTHLCQQGCSIYRNRPATCRQYACLWRAGAIKGDERTRPDVLGVVFHPTNADGKTVLELWETEPGASGSRRVRYLRKKLMNSARFDEWQVVPANQSPGETVEQIMRFTEVDGEWRFRELLPAQCP